MKQRIKYGDLKKMAIEYNANTGEKLTKAGFKYRLEKGLLEKKPLLWERRKYEIAVGVIKYLTIVMMSGVSEFRKEYVMEAVNRNTKDEREVEYIEKMLPDTVTISDILRIAE